LGGTVMTTSGVRVVLLCLCAVIPAGAQERPIPALEFVTIQPGTFRMGCSEGDKLCDPDENPAHQVRLTKSFAIGKFEVTQAQWSALMENNPSRSCCSRDQGSRWERLQSVRCWLASPFAMWP